MVYPSERVDDFIQLADQLEDEIDDIVVEGKSNDDGSNAFIVRAGQSNTAPVIHQQPADAQLDPPTVAERIREFLHTPKA